MSRKIENIPDTPIKVVLQEMSKMIRGRVDVLRARVKEQQALANLLEAEIRGLEWVDIKIREEIGGPQENHG